MTKYAMASIGLLAIYVSLTTISLAQTQSGTIAPTGSSSQAIPMGPTAQPTGSTMQPLRTPSQPASLGTYSSYGSSTAPSNVQQYPYGGTGPQSQTGFSPTITPNNPGTGNNASQLGLSTPPAASSTPNQTDAGTTPSMSQGAYGSTPITPGSSTVQTQTTTTTTQSQYGSSSTTPSVNPNAPATSVPPVSSTSSNAPVGSGVSSLTINQQFGYVQYEVIVGSATSPNVTPPLLIGPNNTSILVVNPTPQPVNFSVPSLNLNEQVPPNGARVVQIDRAMAASLTPGQQVAYYINDTNGDVIASSQLINNVEIVSLINTNTQVAVTEEKETTTVTTTPPRRSERRSTVRGYW